MFGRSQFNKTTFNVTAPFLGLYVDIRARYDVSVPRLSARVDLGEVNFRSNFAMESDLLYVRVPFAETAMRSEFSVVAKLAEMVPIGNVEIPVITSVTAPALKDDATEEFSLENVFLAPDDVLIIDTDVLEIQLNDENLLESWVTGGVFFQLLPGNNRIQIDTNPGDCNLAITVLWADRYL